MSNAGRFGCSALKLISGTITAFTWDDMRASLQRAPSCSHGPTLSGRPPTIEMLELVKCTDLTGHLHLYIRPSNDALVCYAGLRGPFHVSSISYPLGGVHALPRAETVEEIYDAGTGDLLVFRLGRWQP